MQRKKAHCFAPTAQWNALRLRRIPSDCAMQSSALHGEAELCMQSKPFALHTKRSFVTQRKERGLQSGALYATQRTWFLQSGALYRISGALYRINGTL